MEIKQTRSIGRAVELLREKNHCLEKYYWINESEMLRMAAGNFDFVEAFYTARNSVLELIAKIDTEIAEVCGESGPAKAKIDEETRFEVEAILTARDELVKSILAQDLKILSFVEIEKSQIIRELKSTGQAKKAVGAYANSERMKHLDQD